MVEIAARQQQLVPPQKKACIDKARSTAWKTGQNEHGDLAAGVSRVSGTKVMDGTG